MRTDDPRPPASPLGRLRARADRARRWVAGRGPGTRLALVAIVLAALASAGYYAATAEPAPSDWLYAGAKFPRESLDKIAAALSSAQIPYQFNKRGQVAVAADRKAEAIAALDRAKIRPPSLKSFHDEQLKTTLWPSAPELEDRQNRALAVELETLIEDLPGIASADVMINRTPTRRGASPARDAKVVALIHLDGEDDRPVPHRTVEKIKNILLARVPDLPRDGMTVYDKYRDYLVAGQPDVETQSQVRAREEELGDAVLQRLVDRIEGVRVAVNLEAAPAATPAPAPAVSAVMVPNRPVGEEPESPAAPVAPPAPMARAAGKFRVLVEVPITYYLNCFRSVAPDRRPSPEDLRPIAERTEGMIREAVSGSVPASELGNLMIRRYDVPTPPRPAAVAPEAVAIRLRGWWLAAGASAVVALTMTATAALHIRSTRRPAPRAARPARRPHYEVTDPAAGPSAKVRELVRVDPEAAAGVLNRWIGEGVEGGPET
jgi:type III secretory pathway lipoprotein EscJ